MKNAIVSVSFVHIGTMAFIIFMSGVFVHSFRCCFSCGSFFRYQVQHQRYAGAKNGSSDDTALYTEFAACEEGMG